MSARTWWRALSLEQKRHAAGCAVLVVVICALWGMACGALVALNQ